MVKKVLRIRTAAERQTFFRTYSKATNRTDRSREVAAAVWSEKADTGSLK